MSTSTDRRASGVNRVPVATVVEICGRDAQVPAFEADAVELSGRGMQVRTEYLPELNAPLVLRFEDRGREVVVEGEVAWRKEGEETCEFGIKFTALDGRSVEVLRDLCAAPSAAEPPEEAPIAAPQVGGAGSPVKLHIEGLNAPMKARVRDSNGRRMQVGSNLEFLKVGRSIEVEDVDQGERRDARIDSVTVAIDPQTQVPQLVVALRYAGDATPEPSVVDAPASDEDLDEMDMASAGDEPDWNEMGEESSDLIAPPSEDDLQDDEDSALARKLKGRFAVAASRIGAMVKQGGSQAGALSVTASKGAMEMAKGLGQQIASFRAKRMQPAAGRRQMSGVPTAGLKTEGRKIRLQPQHRGHAGTGSMSGGPLSAGSHGAGPHSAGPHSAGSMSAGPASRRLQSAGSAPTPALGRSKLMIGAVLLVAGSVGATVALSHKSSDSKKADAVQPVVEPYVATPATPAAAQPAVNQFAPGQPVPALNQAQPTVNSAQQGIVADVPLFGPTTLATAQPEPLAAPAAVAYEDQAPDVAFDDQAPAADKAVEEASPSKPSPEDVKPWSKGKLHEPIVHRLRLNEPGAALKGYEKSDGFSVVIPDRKIIDNPKVIVKRDDRIRSVTAEPSKEGAVIKFHFRGTVPSYKVRLRNDYVEFFISSPGGG